MRPRVVMMRIGLAAAVAALASALATGSASGERAQAGKVIASLRAQMVPHFLPRNRTVPVSIDFSSELRTADRSPLPPLRHISLVLGGNGRIDYRGLPLCPEARIRATTRRGALRECGPALIGRGHMDGSINIDGQDPFSFRGNLLLFNGRLADGRHVAYAAVLSKAPPVSFVLSFVIRPREGRGGAELSARMPRVAGGLVRISHLDLVLGRLGGATGDHGYLNASCPVPRGFTAFVVPVMEATYAFAGGREVNVVASRGCSVRR